MAKKIAIVTGANTGLGLELSKRLLANNYEVILACRNLEKGQNAINSILYAKSSAVLMELDLANLQSVRNFAAKFKEQYSTLDLLVNNAGLSVDFGCKSIYRTVDGFELTVGTNHLGHFLLTNLLLDVLKSTAAKTGDVRIINVTSMLHQYGGNKRPMKDQKPMDFDDMMLETPNAFTGIQAYKNSKAMNVMFTKKLSRMLAGTGITSNCICPGFVPTTEFMRNANCCVACLLKCCLPCLNLFGVTRTVNTASGHMYDVSTNPDLKDISGEWFTDGKRVESSEETRSEGNQEFLWNWSAEKVGL